MFRGSNPSRLLAALLLAVPLNALSAQGRCGGAGPPPGVIVRGGKPATFGANPPPRRVSVGHVSFGISPWDADGVKKELDTRSLTGRPDTGGKGDIHTASYQSYHTTTPDGFDLQISNATKATRTIR